MMNEITLKKIIQEIGYYYYAKNNSNVQRSNEEINDLQITNIKLNDDEVTIELSRPGLLIGFKGQNLDNLKRFLQDVFCVKLKFNIIENTILSSLYDYQYAEIDMELL
jgi:ribosomal protein S3